MGSLLDRVRRVIGRERAGPLLGLLMGAALFVALPAQAALAATITTDGGRTIIYQDEGGENNTLIVSKQQGTGVLIFEDLGTTITTALVNCTGSGSSVVSCDNDSTGAGGPAYNLIDISVGDLEDTVHNNTNIKSHIDGGTEDDILFGGSNDDVIDGGDGDDEIHGGKGNDELNGDDGDDVITGDDGDDVINGGDGDDDMSGNDGDDIIDTGTGTGAEPEIVVGGDGDDVVFFHYDADPGTVSVKKFSLQEIFVDTDDNSVRLTTVEQLHLFNDTEDGEDQYEIGDLTGRTLKVIVLQSAVDDDATALNADASITVDGTSGPDKIVLNQTTVIGGPLLPTLTMGNGQTPWGQIVFRGPPAGNKNTTFVTVNAAEGDDSFDVDLSVPLGNEVKLALNGGSGNNTLAFSKPDKDEFFLDLTEPGKPEAGTLTAGSAFGDVEFSDISEVSLDGKGHDVDMTLLTPVDPEDLVYTPGNQNGTGKVEVNSFPVDSGGPDLIVFDFKGVGSDGSLTFDNDGGDGDNLEYNGSSRNETFTVLDTGEIDLTSTINSVKVLTPGVADLTINAGNGNDTIDLTDGPVPFDSVDLNGEDGDDTFKIVSGQTADITVNGGAPSASDTLALVCGVPACDDIVIDLENGTIDGFGPTISVAQVENVTVNAGGDHDLTVLGEDGNDEINYTPTGANAGTIEPSSNDIKKILFTNLSGDLTIDGGDGDNIIRTLGTSGEDEIEITADDPNTTTQVGNKKALLTVNENTETLAVDSGAGKDVITYIAQCDIALHLLIDGNTPGGTTLSGDTLNIETPDDNDAESKTALGHDPSSGNIQVCSQKGADTSEVEFERIERIDAEDAGGDNGDGATQPDAAFVSLADSGSNTNKKKLTNGKTRGEDVYGGADSGKGGQNVSGANRGPRITSSGGKLTTSLLIENDGPSGPDSYVVVVASETIQGVGGNNPDPGVTVKVKDENGSFKDAGDDGATVGPVDEGAQLASAIQITTNGARQGRHKLIINIFSENGGGDDADNKFVDSITIYFTVSK